MCGGYPYPHPAGHVIAQLVSGQEVKVAKGFGFPKKQEDSTCIIARVVGYSALCADGTLLGCMDGAGVTPTDVIHQTFELSDAAKQKIAEVDAEKQT
jgi:hypothetical protein